MLPLDEVWYRRLLVLALGLGVAGGVFALLYGAVTGFGITWLFGEPSSEPFSGRWWWIPLIAGGAVLVVFLRQRAGVAGPVPGAIATARKAWVDPRTPTPLVLISVISLIVGASLGPSFGVVVAAGGVGSWFVSRRAEASGSEREETSLAGMAGGLGALFSAPLFAAVMASELSPTSKRDYVAAFIPQFVGTAAGAVEVAVVAAVFLSVVLVGDVLWALFASSAGRVLGRYASWRNRVTGAFLTAAGIGLALSRR